LKSPSFLCGDIEGFGLEGLLRRGVRAGYRRVDEPTATQMVED